MKIAIVGAGLYGATVASVFSAETGHQIDVYEADAVVGGNIRSEWCHDAGCHWNLYGAHIFHTNSDRVWAHVTKFASFNSYRHFVKADAGAKYPLLDLPFGMALFNQVLGLSSPAEAELYLDTIKQDSFNKDQSTVESWCLANIGPDLYNVVVKNYTEKQWGRPCSQLPASIVQRLPIRLTHDNTYFHNAKHQGMPVEGYTWMVEAMLAHATVKLGQSVDLAHIERMCRVYDHVFFSGPLDKLFNYSRGPLDYRGLRFDHVVRGCEYWNGAPVVNNLEPATKHPFTRQIEHKLFYPENKSTEKTLVTTEYPAAWNLGDRAYYPLRNDRSLAAHAEYEKMVSKYPNLTVGGRLGAFQYYDMDQVVGMALSHVAKVIK